MSEPSDKGEMKYLYNVELSPKELHSIGLIISQWGCLEHEIFTQTLMTFDEPIEGGDKLPKAMDNLRFFEVLNLWEERVVKKAAGVPKDVLSSQLERIRHYYEFRNAIAHGMWEWDISDPKKINSIRIRKRDIVTTHFTAEDLHDFSMEVAEINFKIRYPGGVEDLASAMSEKGSHISRIGAALLSGHPVADELSGPSPGMTTERAMTRKPYCSPSPSSAFALPPSLARELRRTGRATADKPLTVLCCFL
ncbi:MAG TPA: hypothetical protein VMG39_11005 [Pseudolabrys sp.]|nr:hypothetical protein [Pseudolabrys sp.]